MVSPEFSPVLAPKPADLDELKRMIAMLGHRGPDGYGFYRDERIGLAHARLSIVGLAGGFQPIHNEDRSLWISFNGEIFNHVELRRDLEARGHRFYTRTDTEVIVHAFEEHGPAAWAKLNGQFAIALWDRRRRDLWLVRDRLGILPLFHARQGHHLVFASEAKALFGGGRVTPAFDPARLAQVFTHWSAAPHGSVFAGVESVPAATAIRFDANLVPHQERYWQPDLSGAPSLAGISLDEAADRLEDKLLDAIRLRLRADVPVGVYISGGLDSAVIAALARKLDTTTLHSFGVRFTDAGFDETPQQRLVADHVGTEHHDILCGPQDIQAALPDVVWHSETPLLRTAPAPLFLLSRLVRDRGIRVVLSGEGADEWLAGYDIFKEDKVRRFWARQPDSKARPTLLGRVHPFAAIGGQKGQPAVAGLLQARHDGHRPSFLRPPHPLAKHRLVAAPAERGHPGHRRHGRVRGPHRRSSARWLVALVTARPHAMDRNVQLHDPLSAGQPGRPHRHGQQRRGPLPLSRPHGR